MAIRAIILREITEVARAQNKRLAPLTDDLPLLESGLDSLCIAILVANLDDLLDLDPFSAEQADIPTTIGAFIRMYECAAD